MCLSKKYFYVLVFAFIIMSNFLYVPNFTKVSASQEEGSKAYLLMEYGTGQVLKEHNAEQKLPIASVTKLMTLLITFQSIENGILDYEQLLTASENASGMGGSQVFIDANSEYKVRDLITAIVVSSANDASVVLAEAISGSESEFVAEMNKQASILGMNNTHFSNSTGLPNNEHYSCAKDVAILMRELLQFEGYYQFSNIWMQDFVHPSGRITQMSNTNKLLKSYNGCDAGKTGSTNEAGFCLSASAKRNNMRLISVVLGAENSKTRFKQCSELLDWGFSNYKSVCLISKDTELPIKADVKRATLPQISVKSNVEYWDLIKNGEKSSVEIHYEFNDIRAPLTTRDKVGEAVIVSDGVVLDRIDLFPTQDIQAIKYGESIEKVLNSWKIKK